MTWPEVSRAAARWREALGGAALLALALWWWATALGPLVWLALPAGLAGAALAALGLLRGRLRLGGQGPGVVDIAEGRIAYFGPDIGGAVALEVLEEVALVPGAGGAYWRLSAGGEALAIPVTAAGADALIDAFARLPGFRLDRLPAGLRPAGSAPLVVWHRARPDAPRLGR